VSSLTSPSIDEVLASLPERRSTVLTTEEPPQNEVSGVNNNTEN